VTGAGYEKLNSENFISKEDVIGKAPTIFAKLTESVFEAKATTYSEELAGFLSEREIKQIFPVKDNKKVLNAYYIVTYEGGGFAIIGADERIPEILAFSEDSDFPFESEEITLDMENKEIPLGLHFWLNDMKTAVSLLRTKNINIFMDGDNTVEIYSGGGLPGSYPNEDYPFGYMLTTKWGQKNGYNQYIPLCSSGSQQASAGCGPVALAQIMKYWEYPPVTFNWANMAGTYATTATATLLSDIYDATNSYSDPSDNCATLTVQNQMYYALNNYGYYNSNWFHPFNITTAKNEISSDRPVLLFASVEGNSGAAHYWVTDGQFSLVMIDLNNQANSQEHYYFHMNWGWYGDYNGWYKSNVSSPEYRREKKYGKDLLEVI
jgi:hypothetical protein